MRCHRTKNKNKILLAIESYKNGLSVAQIRKKYGITPKFFKKLLKEHGIQYINRAKNPNKEAFGIIQKNFVSIVKEYEKTKNATAIAKKYNVSLNAIRDWFIRHNIDRRTHVQAPTKEVLQKLTWEIVELYQQGADKSFLAKKFNLTRYHVTKILKQQISKDSLRSTSQATTLKNENPDFQKRAIANNFRSKPFVLPSGKIVKVMGYEDDFLNHVFCNGLLTEKDFDFHSRFYVCYKTFDGKPRKYYPDFYIPRLNLIVEIKSSYTLLVAKEKNKIKFEAAKEKHNFICIVDKEYSEFVSTLIQLKQTTQNS